MLCLVAVRSLHVPCSFIHAPSPVVHCAMVGCPRARRGPSTGRPQNERAVLWSRRAWVRGALGGGRAGPTQPVVKARSPTRVVEGGPGSPTRVVGGARVADARGWGARLFARARLSAKCTWLEHRAGFWRRFSLIEPVLVARAGRSTLGHMGADARAGRSVRPRICTATSGGQAGGRGLVKGPVVGAWRTSRWSRPSQRPGGRRPDKARSRSR